MAKIFSTQTKSNRSRLLLRAGLSIFLFLLIHKPDAANTTSEQYTALALKQEIVCKTASAAPKPATNGKESEFLVSLKR